MNTTHHPENQNPNQGTADLGQISSNHANPEPWAIVENAGTNYENIVKDCRTLREACRYIERHYTDDDCPADVMRRLDDGTLTTEF